MRLLWLFTILLLLALLHAAESKQSTTSVVVTPVISTAVTASGQAIVLPQKDVHVAVSTFNIPSGADLPEHKHPFARYAYVVTGTLRVTNTATNKSEVYKKGDFIVEAIGVWHKAANIGKGPVKLIVIDQVEGEQNNTVMR